MIILAIIFFWIITAEAREGRAKVVKDDLQLARGLVDVDAFDEQVQHLEPLPRDQGLQKIIEAVENPERGVDPAYGVGFDREPLAVARGGVR